MKRLFLSVFLLGSCLALAACADQEANAEQPMPKAEQKKPEEKAVQVQKKKTIHPHGSKQISKAADFDVPQHFFRKQPPCAKERIRGAYEVAS